MEGLEPIVARWPLGTRGIPARGATVLLGVAACVALAGCGPAGLDFRQDHRLAIVAPQAFTSVTLPVRVEWRFTDPLGTPGGADQFAVFVDSAPIGPGESIAALDRAARSGVTLTRSTSLPLTSLVGGSGTTSLNEHDVTVVLLDASGRRIGEAAAYVAFYVGT